jgi:multiple sugar transport system permease protein
MKTPNSALEPSALAKWVAGIVVVTYAVISLIPLAWIFMTGFRTPSDAIAYPPKLIAQPSLVGYVNLFTTRSRVGAEELAALPTRSRAFACRARTTCCSSSSPRG